MKGKKEKKEPSEIKGSQKKEPTNLKRKKCPSNEYNYDSNGKYKQNDENYKISSSEVNIVRKGKKKKLTEESEKKEAENISFPLENNDGEYQSNGDGPTMSNVEIGRVKKAPHKVKGVKESISRGEGEKGNSKENVNQKDGNKKKKKDGAHGSNSSSMPLARGTDMAIDGEGAKGTTNRMVGRMDNGVAKDEGKEEKQKEEEHAQQQQQQQQKQQQQQQQEKLMMKEIKKYYGIVKVRKPNSQFGQGYLSTLKIKLNTNVKVSDSLAIVQLSSPEDADNTLVSPFMCEASKSLKAECIKGVAKDVSQLDDHLKYVRGKLPLEIIDNFIFKNKTHDYDKWVPECRILLVTGLPFDQREENILHSLIDIYYENQDRDPILDMLDIDKSDYLLDCVNLYTAVEEHPNKYELFANHLGIIKFALLFGTKTNASINMIDQTHLLFNLSELCRTNHCPVGSIGSLYFKNEQYAKKFWMVFKLSANCMYEKYVRLCPDKNELKVYIEASIYFIMPGALFVNINYAQLNLVLNILQQKRPIVFEKINNVKLRYPGKTIWDLISANVTLDDVLYAEATSKHVAGERIPEGNDHMRGSSIGYISDEMVSVAKGKMNQHSPNRMNEQKDENVMKDVLGGVREGELNYERDYDDSQSPGWATDHILNECDSEKSFDENDIHEMEDAENAFHYKIHCIPNFLMRIYNTHINRYLLDNGLCLLACPYLDMESGGKVANFLIKFHLLDWTYSERDDACYFYLFKSILSVFAVSKRVFKGTFNYVVTTLFLKLPFGLVPALYIRVNPKLLGNMGDGLNVTPAKMLEEMTEMRQMKDATEVRGSTEKTRNDEQAHTENSILTPA
ncbi:conserved Plasmodium protein, unknown function [Plasmodium knowlesi strain H]|uniref:Uncharacterized protein n=3 Tax=Plasmodium knowlesi TaxID=5850 RepID=A0A5K1V006_PLAKH|nr:conserved Plasmodium protein, unknown function [Plasmodium knowlesi strain H]OTN63637.1 Uncharacterized protein PKNOH_S140228000 [Plasmodium knowlesi]CAA9990707.1 conserved Plasmodium protein, unknown function [Plasmodium knowlesi strain H]SBO25890.1 conserved Plasmodium protein, unknown function [Plasmodium knowlesi strain H]SBO28650.1 conserved Plasmodium protein, unknown function [Plasmodium knowlesi strain H]VVS80181.1 conserved Plasmodium protein, unknown function [Plasmodium knowlesi |eukprot:XP_002261997.1 hypothetical protein, conserved in Plasmodium species [Plasmodium knowlesi strain H]